MTGRAAWSDALGLLILVKEREPITKELRVNERVRVSSVRLISAGGEQLGVVPVEEALEQAQQAGLDMVEVAPRATPPVCKLMDYGKYKYRQRKREQQAKHSHAGEMKAIRLGPKIEEHDLYFKLRRVREFLSRGQRVQLNVRFRGAQMRHVESGEQVLRRCIEELADMAKVERPIKMEGRVMSLILGYKLEGGSQEKSSSSSSASSGESN